MVRIKQTCNARVGGHPLYRARNQLFCLGASWRLKGKIWSPDQNVWSPNYLIYNFHENMILNVTLRTRKVIINSALKKSSLATRRRRLVHRDSFQHRLSEVELYRQLIFHFLLLELRCDDHRVHRR